MSDPLMSTIYGWGANWAPRNWALCQSQLLPIAQMSALFSLLGTIYGGDGRTTFALPDLRGRTPVNHGKGAGLSDYRIGEKTGWENATLNLLNLPSHSHTATTNALSFSPPAATTSSSAEVGGQTAGQSVLGKFDVSNPPPGQFTGSLYADSGDADSTLAAGPLEGLMTVGAAGASQQIRLIQPIQTISFIIALYGIYPSRS